MTVSRLRSGTKVVAGLRQHEKSVWSVLSLSEQFRSFPQSTSFFARGQGSGKPSIDTDYYDGFVKDANARAKRSSKPDRRSSISRPLPKPAMNYSRNTQDRGDRHRSGPRRSNEGKFSKRSTKNIFLRSSDEETTTPPKRMFRQDWIEMAQNSVPEAKEGRKSSVYRRGGGKSKNKSTGHVRKPDKNK